MEDPNVELDSEGSNVMSNPNFEESVVLQNEENLSQGQSKGKY